MRVAAALLAAAALAQDAAAQGVAFVTEGAVRHACGGAGVEERQALAALEAEANLKLLFVTQKRGGYLADVEVTIADRAGTVLLRTLAPGPVCVLRLAEGRYRVSAAQGGVTRAAAAHVRGEPGRPPSVVFAFPAEPWDGIWASREEKALARARQH